MEKKIVHRFQKNSREEIIVSVTKYKGSSYIDIRAFVDDPNNSGEKIPTKKGLTIDVSLYAELCTGVDKLETVLADLGY